MQEFTQSIKGLSNGLRTFPGKRNGGMLSKCLNLQPWEGKLISARDITPPFGYDEETYPYPQMHFGLSYFLLHLNEIECLDNDFNTVSSIQVQPGKSWHVADFGGYVVFANGVQVVTWDLANGFKLDHNLPVFSSCCNFNGQLFVGGFIEPWEAAGISDVGWSKIGSAKFVLDQSNDSGYAMLTDGGELMRVLPFKNGVIAYTNRSAYYFTPTIEPVVGFAKEELPIPGVISRSAVNGSKELHMLIDQLGNLWRVSEHKGAERLEYKEFFRKMLHRDIVVTYNKENLTFDIAGPEESFRFSEHGLCQTWQAVTSQDIIQGGHVGLFVPVSSKGFELETEVFDMGFRGSKTMTSIEIGGQFGEPVFVSASWKNSNEKKFRQTPWVRVNDTGWARVRVVADEFIVHVQSNTSERVEIDYILVKYQISDRKNLRGNTSVSQTDAGPDS